MSQTQSSTPIQGQCSTLFDNRAIAQSWRRVWDEVIPFYAFPSEVRRILYTTNAIEALNATLRRAVRARGHFPTDEAALKLLYLVLNRSEKAWKMGLRIPTKPAGDSDLKPAVILRRSRPPVRSEAGR